MASKPVLHREIYKFVTHYLGKGCFAPHTGQDWASWVAWVYLLEAYARGDDAGRRAVKASMRALLDGGIQRDRHDISATFRKAIPGVLDWPDETKLWDEVANRSVGPV